MQLSRLARGNGMQPPSSDESGVGEQLAEWQILKISALPQGSLVQRELSFPPHPQIEALGFDLERKKEPMDMQLPRLVRGSGM